MYKLFLREKNINTENIKISKHREKKINRFGVHERNFEQIPQPLIYHRRLDQLK